MITKYNEEVVNSMLQINKHMEKMKKKSKQDKGALECYSKGRKHATWVVRVIGKVKSEQNLKQVRDFMKLKSQIKEPLEQTH